MVPMTRTRISNIVTSLSYRYVSPVSLNPQAFMVPFCLKQTKAGRKKTTDHFPIKVLRKGECFEWVALLY